MTLTPEETFLAVDAIRAERERGKFATYFPDCTDRCRPRSADPADHVGMCRVLYRKHVAWFNAPDRERLMIAARCCGAASRLIDEATAFARERIINGKPITERIMSVTEHG